MIEDGQPDVSPPPWEVPEMSIPTMLLFAVIDLTVVVFLAFCFFCIARSPLLMSSLIGALSVAGAALLHSVFYDIWLHRKLGELGKRLKKAREELEHEGSGC